jgi:TRAP-type C4-dicarboxylate transport system permease small subunit
LGIGTFLEIAIYASITAGIAPHALLIWTAANFGADPVMVAGGFQEYNMTNHVVIIVNSFLEILLTIVMTILVLDVIWQVFARWIINNPKLGIAESIRSFFIWMKVNPTFPWTEELATFSMIWVGMLGASVALKRGSHLGIDYLVSKFSFRSRLITEVFTFSCIGLFSLFGMLLGGIFLVSRTLELGQTSPAMRIPMGYVYLAVPISGLFLVLYSIELLTERIRAITKISKETANQVSIRSSLDYFPTYG